MVSKESKLSRSVAWKVLDYEVLMFLGTTYVRKHLQGGNGPQTQIIRNALVESSLLHSRILAELFLSRGNWPDNIRLDELGLVLGSNGDGFAEKVSALENAYGKANDENGTCWIINKMLAHPTTRRSGNYDYGAVFAALDRPLRSLIEHIYTSAKRQLPHPL